jgi:hypothetical protein
VFVTQLHLLRTCLAICFIGAPKIGNNFIQKYKEFKSRIIYNKYPRDAEQHKLSSLIDQKQHHRVHLLLIDNYLHVGNDENIV